MNTQELINRSPAHAKEWAQSEPIVKVADMIANLGKELMLLPLDEHNFYHHKAILKAVLDGACLEFTGESF